MKLLVEQFETDYLIENNDSGKKNYFINGLFMQAETKNRNGRIYPLPIMESQVNAYQKIVNERRSVGELQHPATPSINPDRVSHLITELKMDGKNVIGKAKILETPMGKIVKSLMDEDIRMGVSSRGLGSLKESSNGKIVQNDFMLSTVDIVHDPSGPDCFVDNLVENTEWFFDGIEWHKRELVQNIVEDFKQLNREAREQEFVKMFKKLMRTI